MDSPKSRAFGSQAVVLLPLPCLSLGGEGTVSSRLYPSSPPFLPGSVTVQCFRGYLRWPSLFIQMRCNLFVLRAFGEMSVSFIALSHGFLVVNLVLHPFKKVNHWENAVTDHLRDSSFLSRLGYRGRHRDRL